MSITGISIIVLGVACICNGLSILFLTLRMRDKP
jgi:hypothetical protein